MKTDNTMQLAHDYLDGKVKDNPQVLEMGNTVRQGFSPMGSSYSGFSGYGESAMNISPSK